MIAIWVKYNQRNHGNSKQYLNHFMKVVFIILSLHTKAL